MGFCRFGQLKDERPQPVDALTLQQDYTILAVAEDGQQVLLDSAPQRQGSSQWWHQGAIAEVTCHSDATCNLSSDYLLHPGQQLIQKSFVTSTDEVHQDFVSFWRPRWQKHANTSPGRWERIFAFAQAFLPTRTFSLPDISVDRWRYKVIAARGTDGYAKLDIRQLFHGIERGTCQWPRQLLTGIVKRLAKSSIAEVKDFRPIVIFSLIYRTWAATRCNDLLRQLAPLFDCDAYGFLPGREAAEHLYTLQSRIEIATQCGTGLAGITTDFVKAFNSLPCLPTLAIASHVGVPQGLLAAWASFLGNFQPRFAEGCPMSVFAMCLVDFGTPPLLQVF